MLILIHDTLVCIINVYGKYTYSIYYKIGRYIYTELGTIFKKCIIDTITITHFFLIIDTNTITLKKIIVDTITNTEFS